MVLSGCLATSVMLLFWLAITAYDAYTGGMRWQIAFLALPAIFAASLPIAASKILHLDEEEQ